MSLYVYVTETQMDKNKTSAQQEKLILIGAK